MVATPSTMVTLGMSAPTFTLPDTVSGQMVSLDERKSDKATVIMFVCNHCPFVLHVNAQLVQLANDYLLKGVAFIAISSNDVENYPADAPDKMKEVAKNLGYPFPYLYDETQDVAKAYSAACTPDFFLFDHDKQLFYRGQFDSARPGNDLPITGIDLSAAVQSLVGKLPAPDAQTPSMGCNIKWKRGNEPDYFG